MPDVLAEFRNAIEASGLQPPENIEPGKFYRFPGVGKRNGNKAGWCKLFDDSLGGCFGDWSSGISKSWRAKRDKPMSQNEQAEFARKVDAAKRQVEAEREVRQENAAKCAMNIWSNATLATDTHPYLRRKKIKAYGIRLYKNALVIPVLKDNKFLSLQFIAKDGSKRFLSGGQLSGGYFRIGSLQDSDRLCIAEGYATGASIHQATGKPVVVAFNAGNMGVVARIMRDRFPDHTIILCADDDAETEGNPGLTKATKAAQSINGLLAVPEFASQRPPGASDFNDMASLVGLEAVAEVIQKAAALGQDNSSWPEPQSLIAEIHPEPYPVDALPDAVRAAVVEVQAFTKAPLPMVASSALAALSLAAQAHADVARAEKLSGPISLFLLTVADSGERKTTCDGFFMRAIREYEANQAKLTTQLIENYEADMQAWESKVAGVTDKIRQLAKKGEPTDDDEVDLHELEHDKPKPPFVPRLIYGDITPEELKWKLATKWPSASVVSSEAGQVLGSHGMNRDSIMRNLATLNQLWDGTEINTDRRTSESFTVRGARLSVALQVQEVTLRTFFDRSGGLARGTGFLARFLLAWPESTQGYRLFSEPPANWPALSKFDRRISAILEQDTPIDDFGGLTPPVFQLTGQTKAAWVKFHDAIEIELRDGGELYDVRDVASKTADNAARIATLFHIFETGATGTVELAAFEGAARIAAWHLNEARRFFGELALPTEAANAERLDKWLLDYCRRGHTSIIPRREIQRNVTPGFLRKAAALDAALVELEDAGRICQIQDGRRKEVHLNPALLEDRDQ